MVNFIGTLGFSLILPFLIFLVTKFGGNAHIYGVLGATYPAFQLIGAPILGKFARSHTIVHPVEILFGLFGIKRWVTLSLFVETN